MNQDNNSNNRSNNGIPDIFNMPLGGNDGNNETSGGTQSQINPGIVGQANVGANPVPPVRPVAPQTPRTSGMMGQTNVGANPVPPVRPVVPQTPETSGVMGQANVGANSVPPVKPVAPQTPRTSGMMGQTNVGANSVPPVKPVAPQTPRTSGMMGQTNVGANPVPPVRPVVPQTPETPGMMGQANVGANPVPPVRPVVPQTPETPGMMGQTKVGSNSQAGMTESTVTNEWVAAVESQKEPTVVEPTIPVDSPTPKVVVPQTVEDLIAPSTPIEPINNKTEGKASNKKLLLIVIAVVAVLLIIFGAAYVLLNGRSKSLTCTLQDTDNGITYTTIGEFKFKGKKITSVMTGLEYVVTDDTDHSSELQVVGAAFQFLDENVKKRSGVTTKLDTTDKHTKYYVTVDIDKMKDSDWDPNADTMINVDALKEKDKDYKTIKEEYIDQGYTCK